MDCAGRFYRSAGYLPIRPGILAVNISIFIGYKLRGIRGSIITAWEQSYRLSLLYWLSPCSFTVSKTIRSWNASLRESVRSGSTHCRTDLYHGRSAKSTATICGFGCFGIINLAVGFSPIWIIIAAGVGGFLWGKFRKLRVEKES